MTKQQHERAKDLGRQARAAGKKADASPYRNSAALRHLHLAWMEGWNEGRK